MLKRKSFLALFLEGAGQLLGVTGEYRRQKPMKMDSTRHERYQKYLDNVQKYTRKCGVRFDSQEDWFAIGGDIQRALNKRAPRI